MTIDINYEQGKFIRDHAAARIRNARETTWPSYEKRYLSHLTDEQLATNREERRAEIEMLKELIENICQYCEYKYDGLDDDGTKWYHCTVHDELAPSQDAPCAGYIEEPYELRQEQ